MLHTCCYLEKINHNYIVIYGNPRTPNKKTVSVNTYYNLEENSWNMDINHATKIKNLANALFILECVANFYGVKMNKVL